MMLLQGKYQRGGLGPIGKAMSSQELGKYYIQHPWCIREPEQDQRIAYDVIISKHASRWVMIAAAWDVLLPVDGWIEQRNTKAVHAVQPLDLPP
jgi:hypothetical protein